MWVCIFVDQLATGCKEFLKTHQSLERKNQITDKLFIGLSAFPGKEKEKLQRSHESTINSNNGGKKVIKGRQKCWAELKVAY